MSHWEEFRLLLKGDPRNGHKTIHDYRGDAIALRVTAEFVVFPVGKESQNELVNRSIKKGLSDEPVDYR